METTGGDAYWIDGKNERHNRIIHNMVRSVLININQHTIKWCCAEETSAEVYRCKFHIRLDNITNHFAWYGKNPSIHELMIFGCYIYLISSSHKELYDRTQEVSFLGYTNIRDTTKLFYDDV